MASVHLFDHVCLYHLSCPILSYLLQGGFTRLVREFLDRGVNIELPMQEDGSPPLALASERGHINVVKLLLRRGANVDWEGSDGRNALWVLAT